MNDIEIDIDKLIKELFDILSSFDYSKENGIITSDKTNIVFPRKWKHDNTNADNNTEGDIRISEQEAKQIFISLLDREINNSKPNNVKYSVETPSKNSYLFSGKVTPRSALFDLSLYKDGELYCHIEFKAHNTGQKAIHKDLLKLKEGTAHKNYFIHIIFGATKSTYTKLSEKYKGYNSNTYIYQLIFKDRKEGNKLKCIDLNTEEK